MRLYGGGWSAGRPDCKTQPLTERVLRLPLVLQGLLDVEHGRGDAFVPEHPLDLGDGRPSFGME